jgi:hypothetical protein
MPVSQPVTAGSSNLSKRVGNVNQGKRSSSGLHRPNKHDHIVIVHHAKPHPLPSAPRRKHVVTHFRVR